MRQCGKGTSQQLRAFQQSRPLETIACCNKVPIQKRRAQFALFSSYRPIATVDEIILLPTNNPYNSKLTAIELKIQCVGDKLIILCHPSYSK
jgi:hypothetical protein